MRTFAAQIYASLLTTTAIFGFAVSPAAFGQNETAKAIWMTDLSKAEQLAKKNNRLLLVHFYADWCGPCQKMKQETMESTALANQLRGNIVAVKINSDKHPALVRKYQIRALPSDLFVTPTGQILARSEGYLTRQQYLSLVARIDARFDNAEKTRIAKTKVKKEETPRKSDADSRVAKTKRPEKRLIGMDGFSPVALHENRQWKAGKPEFAWKYQDVTFWMADAEELASFKADPRKYAPRLLGCDPVVLNETDRAIQGKIAYGAFFDEQLYFFATNAARKKFRANPRPYTRTRHVLRVDHIGGIVRR